MAKVVAASVFDGWSPSRARRSPTILTAQPALCPALMSMFRPLDFDENEVGADIRLMRFSAFGLAAGRKLCAKMRLPPFVHGKALSRSCVASVLPLAGAENIAEDGGLFRRAKRESIAKIG